MINFSSILVFVTAISALPAITKRDTAKVLANLQSIDSATRNLTSSVNSWDGSLLGALGINRAATANQVDSANTEAKTEAAESSADSKTVIAYINGTLEPDIAASLNALVSKKAKLESDGLQSIVLSTLTSLRNKTSAFSATLEGISSSDQKANSEAVAFKIDADFAAAIQAFS